MATQTKTIEYAIGTNPTTLAAATLRSSSLTIYIPESSPTFRGVEMRYHIRDDGTAAGSPTSFAIGVKLGGAATSTVTVTTTVTNSGETQTFEVNRDVTAYFTSNWSGTSMTFLHEITVGGIATANHSVILRITYDYDDTSSTQIKTVRIPIESTRATLTTSYQTVGGATAIPILSGSGTFLPEHTPVIRQSYIEVWGNENVSNTTDFQLDLEIAGVTSITPVYRSEAGLQSSVWMRAIWDFTGFVGSLTSSAKAFNARSTGVTARYEQLCGWIVVTYEFNAASTTTVLNSIVLPVGSTPGQAFVSTYPDRFTTEFFVEEPATVTLVHSAIYHYEMDAGATTVYIAVGGQIFGTYAKVNHSLTCGQGSCARRFDSGAAGGSGHTLTRGRNVLVTKWHADAITQGSCFSGFAVVNYTSGVSPSGIGAHNRSLWYPVLEFAAAANTRNGAGVRAPNFAGDYYLNGVCHHLAFHSSTPTNLGATVLDISYTGAENSDGDGEGWEPALSFQHVRDIENALTYGFANTTWMFQPWAGAPSIRDQAKMSVKANRSYQISDNDGVWSLLGMWITIHSIEFDVTGTVSGYAGDGSAIPVQVWDTQGRLCRSLPTSAGGGFATTWYDDTIDLFCEAREDSTHVGRSDDGKAG